VCSPGFPYGLSTASMASVLAFGAAA
jgi:hypothetical protein